MYVLHTHMLTYRRMNNNTCTDKQNVRQKITIILSQQYSGFYHKAVVFLSTSGRGNGGDVKIKGLSFRITVLLEALEMFYTHYQNMNSVTTRLNLLLKLKLMKVL
jgi:hypothetical protein